MLVWLTLPFYDFCDFRSVAVNSRLLITFINTTFFDFSTWRPSHLRFLKVRNFNRWSGSEGQYASSCQMLCRSVKPLPRYRFIDFSRWRPPPSWIFEISKILTVWTFKRLKLRHCAKFRQNRSNRGRYITIFRFLQDCGRPPSWICNACVGTTHKGHLVVFITVPNLIGIDAVVLIICMFSILQVWLENAYSRPKIVFLTL